jgi:hypothetical protein
MAIIWLLQDSARLASWPWPRNAISRELGTTSDCAFPRSLRLVTVHGRTSYTSRSLGPTHQDTDLLSWTEEAVFAGIRSCQKSTNLHMFGKCRNDGNVDRQLIQKRRDIMISIVDIMTRKNHMYTCPACLFLNKSLPNLL